MLSTDPGLGYIHTKVLHPVYKHTDRVFQMLITVSSKNKPGVGEDSLKATLISLVIFTILSYKNAFYVRYASEHDISSTSRHLC